MSMETLFSPRSIGVIGASPAPSLGHHVVKNLQNFGYSGTILPINPSHDSVLGLTCFPDLESLPEIPDVVAIATPASSVPKLLGAADRLGIRSAVVVSGSFDSYTDDNLLDPWRSPTHSLVGPNCLGLINIADGIPIFGAGNEHFTDVLAKGDCAVIAQSGGLLLSTLYLGSKRGLSFSYAVSSGNEEFTTSAQYITHLVTHTDTRVICLISEGIRDPRELESALQLAHERSVNVVVLRLGTSRRGKLGIMSHTGSMAGERHLVEALFRDHGVPIVDTLDELVETALLLRGNVFVSGAGGAAILSISGGIAALTSDVSESIGLDLVDFAPETIDKILQLVPALSADDVRNPLDASVSTLYRDDVLNGILAALADDVNVGGIVVPVALDELAGSGTVEGLIQKVCAYKAHKGKGIVLVATTSSALSQRVEHRQGGLFLQDLRNGLLAVRNVLAANVSETRRDQPRGDSSFNAERAEQAACVVRTSGPTVGEVKAKTILAAAGIDCVREQVVSSAPEARSAYDRLGPTVVAKFVSDFVPHRAKLGLVATNLASADAAELAYDHLILRSAGLGNGHDDVIVIQEQIGAEVELLVGAVRDPVMGEHLVLGMGGVFAEVLSDSWVIRLPMSQARAEKAFDAIVKKYTDYLGSTEIYRPAVCQLLVRLAQLFGQLPPSVTSIDLNPVLLAEGRCVVVDALFVKDGDSDLVADHFLDALGASE